MVTVNRIVGPAILAVGFMLAAATPSAPQTYPDRPIKLIVPFPPGGPTDYVARIVGQHMSARLSQVVIENRPGAGGTLAAKAVASAEPDGHTLLYGSSATLGIAPALYKNADYDPIKSFAPIALVSRVPFVLGVAVTVPATTLAEFIAYAKARPGQMNFGASIGTPPHLVGELFKVRTGVSILYVPYKGAAQAMTDLLAGQMHMTIEGATTLLPHIESGKVRPLAVLSPQRMPALPEVPTMIESGYSGFPSSSYTGVLAPANTPTLIADQINAAINAGLASTETQAMFARFSAEAKIGSAQEFADFIASQVPVWGDLVKAAALKVE
jgi:tripartite-type tricarboxylate transporter receptor subunit TctC